MELIGVFSSIFWLVFIGEFGDKTQFAAGTGTLANHGRIRFIYASSVLALIAVSAVTTFLAGYIPTSYLPIITLLGGALLIIYGLYLYSQAGKADEDSKKIDEKSNWKLFFSQFGVVLFAELGDKTQIFTAAAAVRNHGHLWVVFIASALALTAVTTLTVWGITKVPKTWVKTVQRLGAAGMVIYGLYMLLWPN